VLVVEINAIDAEPLKAALACRPHIRRVTTNLPFAVEERDAKLSGQVHLLSYATLQRLSVSA
jgi:hypothetical protein